MATFVLVPGGWSGAWRYHDVAIELRQLGHEVHPVPLTGVGELAERCAATVNLDPHIEGVFGVMEAEQLGGVVWVGHSCGGLVTTGGAAPLPGPTRGLVNSAPYAPADGQSCW